MEKTYSIQGYDLTEEIITQGIISIFRGKKLSNQTTVIIKFINCDYPNESSIEAIKQEYHIIKQLNLAGVIKPISLEPVKNSYAIIFEDISGISLKHFIDSTPVSIETFLNFAIFLTNVLSQIHSKEVVHKDIKPSNIIINPKKNILKIIDFSIASQLEYCQIESAYSKCEGTIAYISPEQTGRMNRSVDFRSDIYSLGVTFFEMLTGQLPFNSNDAGVLIAAHLAKHPPSPSCIVASIPSVLDDIILKCLEKEPHNRYQSALGLKADLDLCKSQLIELNQISPFALGQKDISTVFHIPETLFGREDAFDFLKEIFTVNSNTIEYLLIKGEQGVGKSALLNEISTIPETQNAFVIKGTCDPFKQEKPYQILTEAFEQILDIVLTQSENDIFQWKEALLKAIGLNGKILIDIMPYLELLIGPQQDVQKLDPIETKNRFNHTFFAFLRVCTSQENPLILIIDNCQWCDSPTLKLLEELAFQKDLTNIMIIISGNCNQLNETHLVPATITEIEKIKTIHKINLTPLTKSDIQKLLKSAFKTSMENYRNLGMILSEKTQGNPFFIQVLLQKCSQEKYFQFDTKQQEWICNIDAISAIDISPNVLDIILEKIDQLPIITRNILSIAACIGNLFDIHLLYRITAYAESDIQSAIIEALTHQIISPHKTSFNRIFFEKFAVKEKILPGKFIFTFQHDKLRDILYSYLSENEQQTTHLSIAQSLYNSIKQSQSEEFILDIALHFNKGYKLIKSDADIQLLKQLNLKATEKAKSSNAFEAALGFIQTAINLTTESDWQQIYDLTYILYKEYIEALYLGPADAAHSPNFQQKLYLNEKLVIQKIIRNKLLVKYFLINQALANACFRFAVANPNLICIKAPSGTVQVTLFR